MKKAAGILYDVSGSKRFCPGLGAVFFLGVYPGHSFGQIQRAFVDGAARNSTLKIGFHAQGIEGFDVVQRSYAASRPTAS